MERTIAAFAARRQFGHVLDQVMAKGDQFVVERNGKPIAAVVPIDVYKQWKEAREGFIDRMQEIAERVDLPEDEAMRLANEAVQAVRSQRA